MSAPLHYIVLSGWACDGNVLSPLTRELSKETATVTVIDWNGLRSIQDIYERVSTVIQSKKGYRLVVIGWSLGALAAIDVVAQFCHGEKGVESSSDCRAVSHEGMIDKLILISGTSCFVKQKGDGARNKAGNNPADNPGDKVAYKVGYDAGDNAEYESGDGAGDKVGYEAGWEARVVRRMKKQLQRDKQAVLDDFYQRLFSATERQQGWSTTFYDEYVRYFASDSISSLCLGLDYLLTTDVRNKLPLITCPTLLIHGEKDVICPPTATDVIAQQTGGPVVVHKLPDAGHIPFYTERDECVERIKRFVKSN